MYNHVDEFTAYRWSRPLLRCSKLPKFRDIVGQRV